jgi:curved DNA-binding protein CbpA
MLILKLANIYIIAVHGMSVAEALSIIGISQPFSKEQLSKAYKKKVLEYHPDRARNDIEYSIFSEKSVKINIAKSVLDNLASESSTKEESQDEYDDLDLGDHEPEDIDNPDLFDVRIWPKDKYFYFRDVREAVDFFLECHAKKIDASISSDARNWLDTRDGIIKIRKWRDFYLGKPSHAYAMLMKEFQRRL